jgi:Tfp pilus assembly protein FimT
MIMTLEGNTMHTRQRGISIMGLIVAFAILIVVAVFGMKVVPSYMEYRTAKNGIDAIAREKQGASVADIRRAFEARATIDDITSVKPQDLEITKSGSEVVIAFGYRKEVPLFGGVGLYIDYAATSKSQ